MFITGSTARPDQDRPGVWIAENYFVPDVFGYGDSAKSAFVDLDNKINDNPLIRQNRVLLRERLRYRG
jgi:hypothetical protein